MHSHIIPGIDDGPRTIEDAIEIIREAQKVGFTEIVSTSHYFKGKFEVPENERIILIENLKEQLKKENINVKIHLASEIFAMPDLLELIENKQASTIEDTKYILIELPRNTEALYFDEILFKVMAKGYIPIIAHPERYTYVQKDPNRLIEYIQRGILFQANYSSIIGYYGKQAQKTVIKLLKNNMIHFLGTDVHRQSTVLSDMNKIISKLTKILTQEKINELTYENAYGILNKKTIYIDEPKRVKLGLFG